MSTLVYVVITAVVFLLGGAALCLFGFAFWYMLKMIKELRAAVERLTKSTDELLGEGSFARISKSLVVLTNSLPEMLGGLKEFSRVMSLVFQTAEPHKSAAPAAAQEDGESAFYPGKSDIEAAVAEVQQEAARQKLVLTADQLAMMHTDEAT